MSSGEYKVHNMVVDNLHRVRNLPFSPEDVKSIDKVQFNSDEVTFFDKLSKIFEISIKYYIILEKK